jgi:hypothetical protein
MAKRASARTAFALLGWTMCLVPCTAAFAQAAGEAPSLGTGLRLASTEALPSPGVALPGRYDWLRTGLTPQQQQSSFALPGQGAFGLSVDQLGRRATGADPNRTEATSMRLQASYLLGHDWGFTSQYEAGAVSDRLSTLQTANPRWESLGVGVFRTGNLLRGDRLSLTVSSPVRTGMGDLLSDRGGSSVSLGGDAFMGLRAGGNREYATELSYFTPLSRDIGLGFAVSQRSNLMRDYGTSEERMMSIRFSSQF